MALSRFLWIAVAALGCMFCVEMLSEYRHLQAMSRAKAKFERTHASAHNYDYNSSNSHDMLPVVLLGWGTENFFSEQNYNYTQHCHHYCTFTTNRDMLPIADAVLFDLPNLAQKRKYQFPKRYHWRQLFVGISMESPSYFPKMANADWISQNFNLTSGYLYYDPQNPKEAQAAETHIFLPYGPQPLLGIPAYARGWNFSADVQFYNNQQQSGKNKKGVCWFGSNCEDHSGRKQLVQQLMSHLKIDSYGKCLHNMAENNHSNSSNNNSNNTPQTDEQQATEVRLGPQGRKMTLLGEYMFTLAFENSNCNGYVTEKLWQPLARGSVPIYLGTTTVDSQLPSPDAIIRVSDFPSVSALATYLMELLNGTKPIEKHLQWTQPSFPLPQHFQRFLRASEENSDVMCAICSHVSRARRQQKQLQARPFPACVAPT